MTSGSGTTEHTADLGLWVEAETLEELFQAAGPELAGLMVSGPREGEVAYLPLELDGRDLAELMVQMLAEVVYLWDAEDLLVVSAKTTELHNNRLSMRLGTIPRDPGRHTIAEPVKAVTYHRAKVEKAGGRWRAEVVLDV